MWDKRGAPHEELAILAAVLRHRRRLSGRGEPLNVLDLFSGIGGFSLGLERAGMRTVAFCEIDPFCRRVLAKHWPRVPCYPDVKGLTADRLRADGISADVICGGFPCQDVSVAGRRAGLDGAKSGLWSELRRLVCEIRPCVVVVENTPGLLSLGMGTVLGDLAALGYDAEWHGLPAGGLGAPHIRERVWIIAYSDSWRRRADFTGRHHTNRKDAGRPQADRLLGEVLGPSRQWYLAAPILADDNGERRRQYHRPEIAVLPQHSGLAGEISHDGWDTPWPRFLADLCGVDDGLRGGLDKAGFEHLGNAVVPQIPEIIGRAIMRASAFAPAESKAP